MKIVKEALTLLVLSEGIFYVVAGTGNVNPSAIENLEMYDVEKYDEHLPSRSSNGGDSGYINIEDIFDINLNEEYSPEIAAVKKELRMKMYALKKEEAIKLKSIKMEAINKMETNNGAYGYGDEEGSGGIDIKANAYDYEGGMDIEPTPTGANSYEDHDEELDDGENFFYDHGENDDYDDEEYGKTRTRDKAFDDKQGDYSKLSEDVNLRGSTLALEDYNLDDLGIDYEKEYEDEEKENLEYLELEEDVDYEENGYEDASEVLRDYIDYTELKEDNMTQVEDYNDAYDAYIYESSSKKTQRPRPTTPALYKNLPMPRNNSCPCAKEKISHSKLYLNVIGNSSEVMNEVESLEEAVDVSYNDLNKTRTLQDIRLTRVINEDGEIIDVRKDYDDDEYDKDSNFKFSITLP